MPMLSLTIKATGRRRGDVEDAVHEALRRFMNECTWGFDRNEDSSFEFNTDGKEEEVEAAEEDDNA